MNSSFKIGWLSHIRLVCLISYQRSVACSFSVITESQSMQQVFKRTFDFVALQTPAILDWRLHSDTDSLHYTPNAFAIWCIHEITNDLLAKGGLERIGVLSHTRAQSLYSVIDQSQGFYTNNVDPKYRSYTAIPFCIKRGNRTLETMFVKGAESKGLRQTFGHATVGGLRVAIYNGLPDESLKEVLDYMCEFAQSYKVHTNSQSIPPGLRGLDKQD